jgi:hypothetical protein
MAGILPVTRGRQPLGHHHQAAMALTNRSPKNMANCTFAIRLDIGAFYTSIDRRVMSASRMRTSTRSLHAVTTLKAPMI